MFINEARQGKTQSVVRESRAKLLAGGILFIFILFCYFSIRAFLSHVINSDNRK